MRWKRRFQFRLKSWFWIVLVVAAFFTGRNWDGMVDALKNSPPKTSATADLAIGDGRNFSFFVGISR